MIPYAKEQHHHAHADRSQRQGQQKPYQHVRFSTAQYSRTKAFCYVRKRGA
jgi:hypothetical protein